MNKIYEYDLTEHDLNEFQKKLEKIEYLLLSEDYTKYLGRKMKDALKKIQKQRLKSITTKEDIEESTYMNSNHLEIENGIIYIYNDAAIDISSKNMKETTKANYPAQLSLAKIVEYGIGFTGSKSAKGIEDDWIYDKNEHSNKGWYYIDKNGEKRWTNGYAGRYIFLTLKEYVYEHINEWTESYIIRLLK